MVGVVHAVYIAHRPADSICGALSGCAGYEGFHALSGGACSEHCPTQALSMIPFKDGLTIPHIDTEICVGCGGCEYVCPARPFRAVYIEGNVVQQDAKPFTDDHQEEIQVDDFGF